MMAMTVLTVSVEPTWCAIVRQSPSRSISSGPWRYRTSCSICMTHATSGVCSTCPRFPPWSATNGPRYFEILAAGYAAQPPPPASSAGSHKGRRKQSKAKNLLDTLLGRAEQVLALLDDLRIPFTNNQAERDLRWAKVQQKISGTFRSVTGVAAFCRIRSYLSTMHKQGHPMLSALTAVFHGQPLPLAWAPE